MSTLIRSGGVVVNDDFAYLADDAAIPASGRIIVSFDRWLRERETLKDRTDLAIGVKIPNTTDVMQSWPSLAGRPLVALEFPTFADGRAYSQARLLRSRCKFEGELRATGNAVVRDQLFGMFRCGFDTFELRADQDVGSCLRAFADFSLAYQPAADTRTTVATMRN